MNEPRRDLPQSALTPGARDEHMGEGVESDSARFREFDQVRKNHTYRLAESDEDRFDEDFEVRICDMGAALEGGVAERAAFGRELGAALEGIGFAILTGHGVDPALYERCERRVVELFEELDEDQKMRYRAQRHGSVSQGYFPIKQSSDIHPDLVEGWVFCRRAFDLDPEVAFEESKFWARSGDEALFRQLVQAHEQLVIPLMQSLLLHLGCEAELYDQRLTGTNFGLRLNYYPRIEAAEEELGAGRLLGHEDVDLFTLLPAPGQEGLQVWNHASRRWVRLHAPPGSIVFNTGDYLQRISNDRLPSTTHRVGKPRDGSHRERARVSFPMALYVWEDEVLDVLPGLPKPHYPPIRAITFHTRSTAKFYGADYAVED